RSTLQEAGQIATELISWAVLITLMVTQRKSTGCLQVRQILWGIIQIQQPLILLQIHRVSISYNLRYFISLLRDHARLGRRRQSKNIMSLSLITPLAVMVPIIIR